MTHINTASEFCPMFANNLFHRLAPDRQNIKPEQNRPQPVFLANVIRTCTETFLAAESNAFVIEKVAKEFPTGRSFVVINSQLARNVVQRLTGDHRARNADKPLTVARHQSRIGCQNRQAVARSHIKSPAQNHMTIAIAIRGHTEIGRIGAIH